MFIHTHEFVWLSHLFQGVIDTLIVLVRVRTLLMALIFSSMQKNVTAITAKLNERLCCRTHTVVQQCGCSKPAAAALIIEIRVLKPKIGCIVSAESPQTAQTLVLPDGSIACAGAGNTTSMLLDNNNTGVDRLLHCSISAGGFCRLASMWAVESVARILRH